MASFDFNLDTAPMAQEMGKVSGHVKATTTAVVAMQNAVILAEKQAADHVCSNVNKGFYSLIRSQISQKIAKLQSTVDSHLMQLNQQKKQLLAVKSRMEHDYNMISGRYLKLFNGLNSNLKHRVTELDKPVIDFATKDLEKISNRTKYLTATVPVSQQESLSASQKIIASNLKNKGFKVIHTMSNFLSNIYEQNELTNRILLKDMNPDENKVLSVPLVICESNYDKFDHKNTEITISNINITPQAKSAIKNIVMTNTDLYQWKNEEHLDKELVSAFSKLVSSSNQPDRVKEMTNKLFSANNLKTLKTTLS